LLLTTLQRKIHNTHNRFTALWNLSGTTRVSRYQKKHSPTHTHYGHQSSLSAFSIYYDPWHPPYSIHVLYSLSPQSLSKKAQKINLFTNIRIVFRGVLWTDMHSFAPLEIAALLFEHMILTLSLPSASIVDLQAQCHWRLKSTWCQSCCQWRLQLSVFSIPG